MFISSSSKVAKFGGSSVADAGQFRKIQSIVQSDKTRQVVVVSAPGKRHSKETKLTDLLYTVYDLATKQLDFSSSWALIRDRFLEIAKDLDLNTDVGTDLDLIEQKLKAEPETITVDYVVSRGEYLSARLMSEYLGAKFIDAFDIIQIDAFRKVTPQSQELIASVLAQETLVVIPGFYCKNHKGELRTFSRGGSDITGAVIAHAISAVVYENWTDVSGLLMADPRIVQNPKPMPYVSYSEVRELAYSGANVFHDEAIMPCKIKSIPINIRNTNKPEDVGTIIGPKPERSESIITGVAGRKNFSMIYIHKYLMNSEKGFGRKLLGIFENHGISYEHTPTGIDTMSIIVESDSFLKSEEMVMEEIRTQLNPEKVKVFNDIALIATVGHGMSQHVGVAAKLFTGLAADGINVRIIDQGSSEINIIVGVDACDYENAIRSIYSAFVGA
jgi:aspartate kinase